MKLNNRIERLEKRASARDVHAEMKTQQKVIGNQIREGVEIWESLLGAPESDPQLLSWIDRAVRLEKLGAYTFEGFGEFQRRRG